MAAALYKKPRPSGRRPGSCGVVAQLPGHDPLQKIQRGGHGRVVVVQIMGRGDGGHCRATVNACRVGGGPAVAGSPRNYPARIPCNKYIAAVMGGSLLRRPSLVKNIQKRGWESRCSIFSGGCQKPRSSMLRGGCRIAGTLASKPNTWCQRWSSADHTSSEYNRLLFIFDECCSLVGVGAAFLS